jgi:hypothetical protein
MELSSKVRSKLPVLENKLAPPPLAIANQTLITISTMVERDQNTFFWKAPRDKHFTLV